MKIPSEISFETTETNWVCMIGFLCAHVSISISTYILTSIVIYLPYRLTSSDAIGVVFLFMLVNWWVEKHQRFIFNVYKRFFIFLTFFTFFKVFYFFLERFFTSMVIRPVGTFFSPVPWAEWVRRCSRVDQRIPWTSQTSGGHRQAPYMLLMMTQLQQLASTFADSICMYRCRLLLTVQRQSFHWAVGSLTFVNIFALQNGYSLRSKYYGSSQTILSLSLSLSLSLRSFFRNSISPRIKYGSSARHISMLNWLLCKSGL